MILVATKNKKRFLFSFHHNFTNEIRWIIKCMCCMFSRSLLWSHQYATEIANLVYTLKISKANDRICHSNWNWKQTKHNRCTQRPNKDTLILSSGFSHGFYMISRDAMLQDTWMNIAYGVANIQFLGWITIIVALPWHSSLHFSQSIADNILRRKLWLITNFHLRSLNPLAVHFHSFFTHSPITRHWPPTPALFVCLA